MKHPSVSQDSVLVRLDDLRSGVLADMTNEAAWVGEGASIDLDPLMAAIDDARVSLAARENGATGDVDDDQFEGEIAGRLYLALSQIELAALDDPGFWAYLATGPLWFFVKWRENPAQRSRERYHVYVDGTVNTECVPLRMFLRAQAVDKAGDTSLAAAIPKGVDFWRSHIIRVKIGSKPGLARALVEQQQLDRMAVGPLRDYAKRVTRRWSNEVLHLLTDEECRALADDERQD